MSSVSFSRRRLIQAFGAGALGSLLPVEIVTAAGDPAVVALSLEFGHATSLSDNAIATGVQLAIEDLERAAPGSRFRILQQDNASIPARGQAHMRELARTANVVGVFTGKYSPVVIEMMPLANELEIPIFAPWSAADQITADPKNTPYVFRLSMTDRWAMAAILKRADAQGLRRIGLLAPNSGWGRSCVAAIENLRKRHPRLDVVGTQFYSWGGEATLMPQYLALARAGMDALVFVANEGEAALLATELVRGADRAHLKRPILSHWGLTGGDTVGLSKGAILELDYAFVQTYNFSRARTPLARRVATRAEQKLGIEAIGKFAPQGALAHAYDLMSMVGTAVAGLPKLTGRGVMRAMEDVRNHAGVIKTYAQPYRPGVRDALEEADIFFCRYNRDGALLPVAS